MTSQRRERVPRRRLESEFCDTSPFIGWGKEWEPAKDMEETWPEI